MSTTNLVQEAPDTLQHVEQQQIIDRASVEPEILTEDSQLLGHSKRPFPKRVVLLCSILVLYVLSAVAPAPAMLDIVYRFICFFLDVESDKCLRSDLVTEKVAGFTMVESVLSGISSLIISTYLSALSDRVGRRPVILGAILLSATSSVIMWYLVFHVSNPGSYWWLIGPSLIDYLGGGMPLVIKLNISYISDLVADPRERARTLSAVDGCFFASIAIGPTLGSYIIRQFGIEYLFICSFTGLFIAALLISIFLRESLSNYHKRRNSTNQRSLSSSLSILKFNHIEDPYSRRNARILAVLYVVATETSMAFMGIIALYPRRIFGWNAINTGYMISAMSSTRTFFFLAGFPYLYTKLSSLWEVYTHRIDRVDLVLLRTGIFFSVIGYLFLGLSRSGGQYFVSGVVDALSSIGKPIYTSALIKYVPAGQYGTFMAALNLSCSLIAVFGPTVFLKMYTLTYSTLPFFPFGVITAIFTLIFVGTLFLKISL